MRRRGLRRSRRSIHGDLSLRRGRQEPGGAATWVEGNTVNGDLTVERYRGQSGPFVDRYGWSWDSALIIKDNVVEGKLKCKHNDPAPIGGNNVAYKTKGQCSDI